MKKSTPDVGSVIFLNEGGVRRPHKVTHSNMLEDTCTIEDGRVLKNSEWFFYENPCYKYGYYLMRVQYTRHNSSISQRNDILVNTGNGGMCHLHFSRDEVNDSNELFLAQSEVNAILHSKNVPNVHEYAWPGDGDFYLWVRFDNRSLPLALEELQIVFKGTRFNVNFTEYNEESQTIGCNKTVRGIFERNWDPMEEVYKYRVLQPAPKDKICVFHPKYGKIDAEVISAQSSFWHESCLVKFKYKVPKSFITSGHRFCGKPHGSNSKIREETANHISRMSRMDVKGARLEPIWCFSTEVIENIPRPKST